MNHNKALGKKGEDLACKYLIKNNYNVIEKNFRCKQGEIDIIVKDLSTKELVFVEVKTRSNFPIRFDVIEVFIKNFSFKINHIKQIQ